MARPIGSVVLSIGLVVGLVLTGCASHVQKSQVVQRSINSQSVKNIEIYINENPQYSARRDYAESMTEFRKILQEKIESVFPNTKVVNRAASEPGLRVALTVQDFRYVSSTGRFLTGVMVGNARLRVKVELSDLQTSVNSGEAVFGTTSSAMEGILGGTTSRQIEAVSDSIITFLQEAL